MSTPDNPPTPRDSASADRLRPEDRHGGQRITFFGALANVALALIKLLAGIFGHSYALVADAIHSFADTASDVIVLLALRISGRGPDENHPYGHARFETLATAGLGLSLVVLGLFMAVNALERSTQPAGPTPGALALSAALLSLTVKEGLYHLTIRIARREGSALLKANAWHHRSDALSSVVAFAGILGTIAGFTMLDAVAAAVIAVMLMKIGWDCIWPSVKEFTDTGLDTKEVAKLERLVDGVFEVERVSSLRTRHFGRYVLVDVDIRVNPRCSVSEGHRIAEAVRERLEAGVHNVSGVTVHVEPDEDTAHSTLTSLPTREALERDIRAALSDLPGGERIENLTLHYIDDAVDAEVVVPIDTAETLCGLERLKERYAAAASRVGMLRRLDVKFR